MSRQQRQRDEIVEAFESDDYGRVLVLAREHLAEFPWDDEVEVVAAEARRLWSGRDPAE